jgi:cytochrome c-type biogenesis protein CcmE
MKARTKFIIGGALILGTVGYLMASSIKETGEYYLTPTELATKIRTDHSFYNVGVRMGARVVKGSITRDVASQTITFRATDGTQTYPVVYHGLAPDTFTDGVDVVVEGRLQPDGTFRATTLLAKCASRYEAVPPPTSATHGGAAPAATSAARSAT